MLKKAALRGYGRYGAEEQDFYRENEDWLPDYSLFMALKKHFSQKPYWEWPKEIRDREESAMAVSYTHLPTVWKEEEQHLEETLQEIDRNIEQYSREAAMLREENQERYDTYRSSDSDMHNDLVVGLSWEDQVRFLLRQNRYAADKPYFGRIDYKETQEANGESFPLYIGKHGEMCIIDRDRTDRENETRSYRRTHTQ